MDITRYVENVGSFFFRHFTQELFPADAGVPFYFHAQE